MGRVGQSQEFGETNGDPGCSVIEKGKGGLSGRRMTSRGRKDGNMSNRAQRVVDVWGGGVGGRS